MQKIGLYIHIPFCLRKCPYCNFYSLPLGEEAALDRYTDGLLTALDRWAADTGALADTVYLGGGTPALLGPQRLERILNRVGKRFSLFSGTPEVTLEANPADDLAETFAAFAAAGGNRLSLGMQSACPSELVALGRRHTMEDLIRTVGDARRAGIENLSLDMMLGISGQTTQSACDTVHRAADLGATHLSAYILKLEPDTPYGRTPPPLPDEDAAADIYLATMEALEGEGYRQYEISNAARPGYESRHNLKYWDSLPYLGIGPAASSCYNGKRFSYAPDIEAFLRGEPPLPEAEGAILTGSREEYALLRLRLNEGLTREGFFARFGEEIPVAWRQRAAGLPGTLVTVDEDGIRLSTQGFLLSNTLIRHILSE